MITVYEAEKIILENITSFGTEKISFDKSQGRVLAEDIVADRDLPPFDRVTMDGIAIRYKSYEDGNRQFKIIATQAAGSKPVKIQASDECIEIMTGAALPSSANTVLRYEDLTINNGIATVIVEKIKQGQNIHYRATDKKEHDIMVKSDQYISPQIISIASSVGKETLVVKKNPGVVIVSTGDELVDAGTHPSVFQIRSSNACLLKAAVEKESIEAPVFHLSDNRELLKTELGKYLGLFDVLIITGGISMGKFDMVPSVLEELGVKKYFQKVSQKPGKPFLFGSHANGATVFAFPGNPVSACLCYYRYFVPWLRRSLGIMEDNSMYACLSKEFTFIAPLTYFLQVKLRMNEDGKLIADPITGNGSGDFSTLAETDAFMELPAERDNFEKGEAFRVWILSK